MAARSASAVPPTSRRKFCTSMSKAGDVANQSCVPAATSASAAGASGTRTSNHPRAASQPRTSTAAAAPNSTTPAAKGSTCDHRPAPTNHAAQYPNQATAAISAAVSAATTSTMPASHADRPRRAGRARLRRLTGLRRPADSTSRVTPTAPPRTAAW